MAKTSMKRRSKRSAWLGATGVRMVEDGFDAETGEGAGTIGMELAEWKEQFDAVLLPLGNGALACGVGRYLKEVRPEIRVVAIQSAGAPAMLESWRQKRMVRFDSISTIADGIGVRVPIPECVRDMEGVDRRRNSRKGREPDRSDAAGPRASRALCSNRPARPGSRRFWKIGIASRIRASRSFSAAEISRPSR